MLITAPCVVSLTWRLEDTLENVIDELREPTEFFLGGDDLLEKVEEALLGQDVGFTTKLHLEPEHAFGEYEPSLVFFAEKSLLPEGVDVGMQFEGPPEGVPIEGLAPDALYRVTEVYPEHVVLDGNHPLAGIALRLDLKVEGVREATEAELESKTVGQPIFKVTSETPPDATLH
jgi:FKBP-type peptidyl-prolyl cis-trans isomerase SlyD